MNHRIAIKFWNWEYFHPGQPRPEGKIDEATRVVARWVFRKSTCTKLCARNRTKRRKKFHEFNPST